jgi:hypothetical protein
MPELLEWLREQCHQYELDVVALFKRGGTHDWPLTARDEEELEHQLSQGGHLLSLPKEPAALANVIEVSLVDFLLSRVEDEEGAEARRGTERGYPDIEVSGPAFGGGYHAVDVKVARLAESGNRTQSRITLYTGNTFFRHPDLKWPGSFRPFRDYASHLVVICLYRFTEELPSRVDHLEVLVHPSWQVGSMKRSSTTREYIGAVQNVQSLRDGRGEFETEQDFYKFWRRYRFRTPAALEKQLQRLLREQQRSGNGSG